MSTKAKFISQVKSNEIFNDIKFNSKKIDYNKENRKKEHLKPNTNLIILFLILISMFSQIYAFKKLELRKLADGNYITLTIEATGNHNIISGDYANFISSIEINDNAASDLSILQNSYFCVQLAYSP